MQFPFWSLSFNEVICARESYPLYSHKESCWKGVISTDDFPGPKQPPLAAIHARASGWN